MTKDVPTPFSLLLNRPASPSPAAAPYRGVDLLTPLRGTQAPAWRLPVPEPPPAAPKSRASIAHLYELGRTSIAMAFHQAALEYLCEVTRLAPDHAAAWRGLAELRRYAGQDAEALAADDRAAALPNDVWPPAQGERAAGKLARLDRKMLERLEKISDDQRIAWLRDQLFDHPLDVAAMRYLAFEEDRADDAITAENLLRRALELSPAYLDARADLAKLLMVKRNHVAAYHESAALIAAAPHNFLYRQLRADAAVHMEKFDEAANIYEALLKQQPHNSGVLYAYGALMKTLGRRDQAVDIYRTLLRVVPNSGQAYFGLSELKSTHLTDADVAAMMEHLATGVPDISSRKCMAYALAQALERMHEYEGSFEAYAYGAKVCREEVSGTGQAHDPVVFEERLDRMRRTFTASVISAHARTPPQPVAATPIFVLGMPRAGSTLVEQILASHSLVEGTRELPVVGAVTKHIAMSRLLVAPDVYPERVPEFDRAALDALGADTLRGIAEYRRTTLPFVIDKRPWNWIDIPFLRMILPQAKFIDIRRAPMAAGFAMFKQLLPPDAAFTYDLTHLGRYYRAYVAYMDYLDAVMPGQILRVSYENLVDNTEAEIRRLLDYCGLPFEAGCLRFWETDRAVLTPSAEQVRRPIFRSALEQWRHFEPWLGPLKEALGDLAETP